MSYIPTSSHWTKQLLATFSNGQTIGQHYHTAHVRIGSFGQPYHIVQFYIDFFGQHYHTVLVYIDSFEQL